jgi:membrane protease YdiL (CAAX protease family)
LALLSIGLALYAIKFGKEVFRDDQDLSSELLLKGVITGAFLYTFFYFGYNILEPYVKNGANAVYLFKADSPLFVISVSLIITSFCEEYFWRRYIQTLLIRDYGVEIGLIISSFAYAFIHLPTLNPVLIFTALIAGFYWGVLYEYSRSFWVIVFSHIVWTELIFVFLPLY